MPTGKRASMREGPLAALFRKTAEDTPREERAEEQKPPEGQSQAPEPEQPERHVPSPQERLRHAFSADIPENVMERPAPPKPEPPAEHDVYARPERTAEAFAEARPVGRPVIRVVGVGGAGVNAVNRMVEAEVEGVECLAINTDLQSLEQC